MINDIKAASFEIVNQLLFRRVDRSTTFTKISGRSIYTLGSLEKRERRTKGGLIAGRAGWQEKDIPSRSSPLAVSTRTAHLSGKDFPASPSPPLLLFPSPIRGGSTLMNRATVKTPWPLLDVLCSRDGQEELRAGSVSSRE